jgi:hypothetical protein
MLRAESDSRASQQHFKSSAQTPLPSNAITAIDLSPVSIDLQQTPRGTHAQTVPALGIQRKGGKRV